MHVVDIVGDDVPGATVRVHCDTVKNSGCVVDNKQTTDESGQTIHYFDYEALLTIEAEKDSLYGRGIADLIRGENLIVKVVVK